MLKKTMRQLGYEVKGMLKAVMHAGWLRLEPKESRSTLTPGPLHQERGCTSISQDLSAPL